MYSCFFDMHHLVVLNAGVFSMLCFRYDSILYSRANESMCDGPPGPTPHPTPHQPFPKNPKPSTNCTFKAHSALAGADFSYGSVASADECCGACNMMQDCMAADFVLASPMRPTFQGMMTGGTCHLKSIAHPISEHHGEIQTACIKRS